MPLFLKFVGDPEDEATQTEQHNELRETCLQGFESFVLRCNREIQPHLESITTTSLLFMKFDPNYNYGDDEGTLRYVTLRHVVSRHVTSRHV